MTPASTMATSFDNVETVPKSAFIHRVGAVSPARRHEICKAMRNAVDC